MTDAGASTIPKIIVIGGPTAVGKTDLAVRAANELNGEIINADSMQVYRGMDLGTAKPTPEERGLAPFHLVDVCDPDFPFNAGTFVEMAESAITEIRKRGKVAIVCGGTGMYIKSLIRGLFPAPPTDMKLRERLYDIEKEKGPGTLHAMLNEVDPEKAAALPPSDLLRIVRALEVHQLTGTPMSVYHARHAEMPPLYDAFISCLERDRDELYRMIEIRVDRMMESGLLEEVAGLLQQNISRESNAMQGLGYKQLAAHLNGDLTLEEAVDQIKLGTRRFAKRQWTWFRNQPGVCWYHLPGGETQLLEDAQRFLNAGKDSAKTC